MWRTTAAQRGDGSAQKKKYATRRDGPFIDFVWSGENIPYQIDCNNKIVLLVLFLWLLLCLGWRLRRWLGGNSFRCTWRLLFVVGRLLGSGRLFGRVSGGLGGDTLLAGTGSLLARSFLCQVTTSVGWLVSCLKFVGFFFLLDSIV